MPQHSLPIIAWIFPVRVNLFWPNILTHSITPQFELTLFFPILELNLPPLSTCAWGCHSEAEFSKSTKNCKITGRYGQHDKMSSLHAMAEISDHLIGKEINNPSYLHGCLAIMLSENFSTVIGILGTKKCLLIQRMRPKSENDKWAPLSPPMHTYIIYKMI